MFNLTEEIENQLIKNRDYSKLENHIREHYHTISSVYIKKITEKIYQSCGHSYTAKFDYYANKWEDREYVSYQFSFPDVVLLYLFFKDITRNLRFISHDKLSINISQYGKYFVQVCYKKIKESC